MADSDKITEIARDENAVDAEFDKFEFNHPKYLNFAQRGQVVKFSNEGVLDFFMSISSPKYGAILANLLKLDNIRMLGMVRAKLDELIQAPLAGADLQFEKDYKEANNKVEKEKEKEEENPIQKVPKSTKPKNTAIVTKQKKPTVKYEAPEGYSRDKALTDLKQFIRDARNNNFTANSSAISKRSRVVFDNSNTLPQFQELMLYFNNKMELLGSLTSLLLTVNKGFARVVNKDDKYKELAKYCAERGIEYDILFDFIRMPAFVMFGRSAAEIAKQKLMFCTSKSHLVIDALFPESATVRAAIERAVVDMITKSKSNGENSDSEKKSVSNMRFKSEKTIMLLTSSYWNTIYDEDVRKSFFDRFPTDEERMETLNTTTQSVTGSAVFKDFINKKKEITNKAAEDKFGAILKKEKDTDVVIGNDALKYMNVLTALKGMVNSKGMSGLSINGTKWRFSHKNSFVAFIKKLQGRRNNISHLKLGISESELENPETITLA